jgi:hypothetical protein
MPDYNDEDKSEGFNKKRLYANINIDTRSEKNASLMFGDGWVFNTGIDIKFLGTAVNDTNKTNPTSFSDVSDTVDLSYYIQCVPEMGRFSRDKNLSSELGVIFRIGVLSRDNVGKDSSTVDTYYDAGLRYTFFTGQPYSNGIVTQSPNLTIGGYYRKYSDYNKFNDKGRYIVDFKYKVTEKVYIGAEANIGEGEDELYLTFNIRNDLRDLLKFFGIEKLGS